MIGLELMNDELIIDYIAPKHPPRKYTRLTPSAVRVLNYYLGIVRQVRLNCFCRTLPEIARETGIPERTVWNANDCLQQLGFLNWERRDTKFKRLPNRYFVNIVAVRAYQALPD